MADKIPALLLDTRSIQHFIYAGNKLKTNIGASYLVSHVFDQELVPVLEESFTVDTDSWRTKLAKEKLDQPGQAVFASNAGGNALILFSKDVDDAAVKQVVQKFSRRLLWRIPGLHIGAARGVIDLQKDYKKEIDKLFGKLKEAQNRSFPEVSIPYIGLTLRCPVNGETANFYTKDKKLGRSQHFISQETMVKEQASAKATRELEEKIDQETGICQRYAFPSDLADLGQVKYEKNYFAIVHIDGNNMGKKFRACTDPEQRSRLSEDVSHKTWESFVKLLESIDAEYDKYLQNHALDLRKNRDERPFLPIRPIIIGGDDVTFVCAASMALPYVQRFLQFMLDPAVGNVKEEAAKQIDCCAGIAILKTTYPFFRGYQLAEQLCDAAKQKMRALGASCWLDFAFLHGEQAPTLAEIRAQEYTGADSAVGGLHFGPYRVDAHSSAKSSEHYHDLANLFLAVKELQQGCMTHGNAKELRNALQHGKAAVEQFLIQLEHLQQHLPEVSAWKNFAADRHDLFIGGQTPYVDAIELMEFLPKGDESHAD